jgi:hypothetical protein
MNLATWGFSSNAVSLPPFIVSLGKNSFGSFPSGPWQVLHPNSA